MKIGILTRRYGFNMGSSLQAFAMTEMIRNLGHDVEIINYDETSAHPRWKLRPAIDHTLYYFRRIVKGKYRKYLSQRHAQELNFSKFEQKWLHLSKEVITSSAQLNKISARYDRIVVGSDQIWSPFLFDANFFGAFLEKDQRKKIVAYAPSVGTSNPHLFSDYQKELLKSLSHVSCREYEGCKVIGDILRRPVTQVLDPTLMIPEYVWASMAEYYRVSGLPKKYIVTYFLGLNIQYEEIKRKSQERGIPIINISMFNRPNDIYPDINLENLGPGEFLNVIRNAELVYTDSFHATIFSFIFGKDFRVANKYKDSDRLSQNSRIYSLLNVLGCQSRLIDYNYSDEKSSLEKMKQTSLTYLKSEL